MIFGLRVVDYVRNETYFYIASDDLTGMSLNVRLAKFYDISKSLQKRNCHNLRYPQTIQCGCTYCNAVSLHEW